MPAGCEDDPALKERMSRSGGEGALHGPYRVAAAGDGLEGGALWLLSI
jgi:hypothetical protein